MRQAELKMNYILLSSIAKEKKYAQEYLGLLARRGDIGSIRIGKRWYTTKEWFLEFLQDAEVRKSEAKKGKIRIKLAKDKISEKSEVEKVFSRGGQVWGETCGENFKVEEKPVPLKLMMSRTARGKKLATIDLRTARIEGFPTLLKGPAGGVNSLDKDIGRYTWRGAAEREKMPAGDLSPNFAQAILKATFFQKLAFSTAVMLMLILLFQFSWVYKDELGRVVGFEPGIVAGEESTTFSLAVVKNSSLGCLGKQGDKVKENISFSRVLIKAAMEREAISD